MVLVLVAVFAGAATAALAIPAPPAAAPTASVPRTPAESSTASSAAKCRSTESPGAGGFRSSRRSAIIRWPATSTYSRWVDPLHCTSATVPVTWLGPAPRPTRCGRTHSVAVAPRAASPVGTLSSVPEKSTPSAPTVTGSRFALPTKDAVNSVRGARYNSWGVPTSRSLALSMTAIRSARVSASTWSWVT